eukprot:maker-scaffold_22-snap-gene-3.51-mRNA-1 protein AED:0.01 eAED:0.01 QI:102/1/1/1/1/1/3/104/491
MSSDEEERGGELLFSGNSNWSMIGRSTITSKFDGISSYQLPNFHRFKSLLGVKIMRVITGSTSAHTLTIDSNGTCYSWGRNENGELGQGHVTNVYLPTEIPEFNARGISFAGGATGAHHTILFTESGDCYSAGQGSSGQLGISKLPETQKALTQLNLNGQKIVSAACGREFSVIVSDQGKLLSFGHPIYGQLGNGTEAKSLEKAGKLTYSFGKVPAVVDFADNPLDPNNQPWIVDVACGANHTVARDKDGKIWTWGFGGYGRLGHKDNKNQFQPKALMTFHDEEKKPDLSLPTFMQRTVPATRATKIACGGSSSFAVLGEPYFSLYMWGITKKSGEATMYPKLCDEVSGWRVRSIACGNTSTIVASQRTTITWGPSPTYGELGYGVDGPKSSTKSKAVDDLDKCKTLMVAMGYSHSLVVVDVGEGENKARKIIEDLPVFDPQEVPKEGVEDTGRKRKKPGSKKTAKKAKGEILEEVDDEANGEEAVAVGEQ